MEELSLDQIGPDPGERRLTLEEFASLPWPSEEQFEAFVDHVCDVHSWYKHLSLRAGGQFAFFLASDAGGGFTDETPRLHHTWTKTEDYRRRFGFIDYIGPWGRDGGAGLSLPPEIVEATRTTLFPYVCKCYNAPEACLWGVHADDIQHLLAHGAESPSDQDALRWYSSQSQPGTTPLTAQEIELAWANDESEDVDIDSLPKAVADCIRADREAMSIYFDLQEKEEAKIRGALSRLRELHQQLNRGH